VDVVITTQYSYWQGSDIEDANYTFYQTWATTEAAVNAVSPGIPLWIGETGWPTGSICLEYADGAGGPYDGLAVPSTANLQTYWWNIGCWLQSSNINFWWYAPFDDPGDTRGGVETHFGREILSEIG
jgi:exo-beta-1,3-glucanase (GH17 family)